MTAVLITVDTELSPLLYQQGESLAANVARSLDGQTEAGAFGVGWQMSMLERYGLRGVYFIDPAPTLIYGQAYLSDLVGSILSRGHDVQLHLHTEWLQWAQDAPVASRGQNIGDFSLADQLTLLAFARDALVAAGAPTPMAFRAGNYGANDDTLRALASLGFAWDASYNAAYAGAPCYISLDPATVDPVALLGVTEIPVAAIHDRPGSLRHAQICALSSAEMIAALDHAGASARPAFAIVTHSFEMLSRDRKRPNRIVMKRFEAMCRAIASNPTLQSSGFAELAPATIAAAHGPAERLAPDRLRTLRRIGEQAVATWLYERQLRPV